MSIDPAKVREALRTPTFENSIENVERRAIEILKGAGLPTDGTSVVDDRESPEWHAQNVMWRLGRVREQIRRVGDPGADELARLALSLGNTVWTAMYKIGLEPNTALGAKVRGGGRKGAAAQVATKEMKRDPRIEAWKRARKRGLNKTEADKDAAQECRVSDRVIREARRGLK